MERYEGLVEVFEAHRERLRAVAWRMLGSPHEADDAVQETWLRLARTGGDGLVNQGGWLTTVLSRICLDMLRARAARREESPEEGVEGVESVEGGRGAEPVAHGDPEQEVVLAESVGRALLVVLDRLSPEERAAFVLHDVFAVPFQEIAPLVDRSTAAAKQLASRARRKVRGTPAVPAAELARRRRVIDAFLAAARAGTLDAVLAVLAPDVVRTADAAAVPDGRPTEVRGARAVAEEIVVLGRNARFAEPVLIDGVPGIVVAPRGRPVLALTFSVGDGRVRGYALVGDAGRLARLDVALLPG